MKIFVTGANGFLGSALVRHLIQEGHSVRVLIRGTRKVDTLKGLDIERVEGDILCPEIIDGAVKGCDVVCHLASIYTFYPWWEKKAEAIYQVNVEGTKNILSASLKYHIKRFIFISSIASIGGKSTSRELGDEDVPFNNWRRASHYARSKVMAEQEVMKFCSEGLSAVILNPAVIVGERDYKPTPSGEIIVKFLNRMYPFYFDAVMSFVDVDDVARAIIAAIDHGRTGERYILCNKEAYTIKEIFALLEEISGVPAPKIKIPYHLLYFLVYFNEVLSQFVFKKKPLIPGEGVRFCKMRMAFNNSKAVKELGFTTTPFKETLIKAVDWYRNNGYVRSG